MSDFLDIEVDGFLAWKSFTTLLYTLTFFLAVRHVFNDFDDEAAHSFPLPHAVARLHDLANILRRRLRAQTFLEDVDIDVAFSVHELLQPCASMAQEPRHFPARFLEM